MSNHQSSQAWNQNSCGQSPHNMNHSMLNLNDDYANILSNLAHGSPPVLKESSNIGQGLQNASSPVQNARSGNEKQPNLDLLLQHYQELFSRSNGANSSSTANTNTNTNNTNTNTNTNNNNNNNNNTNNNTNTNNTNTYFNKNNGPTGNKHGQDVPEPSNPGHGSNISAKALAALEQKSVIAEDPCDHCRRRQIKCVIVPGLANCVQCETKGIKCVYSKSPVSHQNMDTSRDAFKRNRVDENVNVHELLKRSKVNAGHEGISENYTDLLRSLDQVTSEKHKRNSDNLSASAMGNLSSPYMMFDSPGQNDPAKSSANSIQTGASPSNFSASTNYNNGQQKMTHTQPPIQYPRSSFYVGPTSVFDINLVNKVKLDKIDQVQLSKTLALRKVAPNVQFLLRDDLNQSLYMKQEQEVDMVEKLVHPHGKILVDIFFKLIHPQFPILHERVFLEKYSRSYRELTAPLLAALYSLSLQWWDFHPQLVGFAKPDVTDQLNKIALRTFFDVIERPKLSIIQTGLLILQCRSENSSNWAICSEVVALAEDLGLGVDCQDWRLPRWERGLRRRLAWAVWLQDKWTSMIEARHSHLILGRNWLVKMLTDEDFPSSSPVISSATGGFQFNSQMLRDVTSPVGGRSMLDLSPTEEDFKNTKIMFQYMISLSIILGEVLDTFYTLGALQTVTRIEEVLKLAKPLQLKMREWYHSLPPQLSMNFFQERKFNSNASLTLSYFAVELTLHRKIITTLSNGSSPELVQVCRLAAKTRLVAAIEFVRDLKFEHINSFWYTGSTGNLTLIGTFAALLYVTAPTKEEAAIFRDCLRNYVWILRMSSKSFEKAGHGLKKIHMLLAQIPGLLTDDISPPQHQQHNLNPLSTLSPLVHQQEVQQHFAPSLAQSPHGSQPAVNQLKGLRPDILHQLTNIQGNMPMIGDSQNAADQNGLNKAPVDEGRDGKNMGQDSNRISPADSSPGAKASPKKGANVEGDTGSPNMPFKRRKEGGQSSDRPTRMVSKSKVLTPQSVTEANGRSSKSTISNDEHPQSGSVFDSQNQDLQVSPRSTEEPQNKDTAAVPDGSSPSLFSKQNGDGQPTPGSQQEVSQEKSDSND
ncbi:LAME_0E00672g1_1 [Lachancea meyersii CBS 8951]|uniref:LAME_0E00672g1_1 n=1 Tax=Lachancea meyersii CBS 8951 TaxID=1266667 RepID=A0A1G4JEK1_9SACH|nr:LAME_0E00672g1_1 [Lachancea meyersii CBS 8951]